MLRAEKKTLPLLNGAYCQFGLAFYKYFSPTAFPALSEAANLRSRRTENVKLKAQIFLGPLLHRNFPNAMIVRISHIHVAIAIHGHTAGAVQH